MKKIHILKNKENWRTDIREAISNKLWKQQDGGVVNCLRMAEAASEITREMSREPAYASGP